MLIDTHAHVNFRSFKDDAMEILQRSLDAGVLVVNIGSQIDTSRQAVELADRFDKGVYACVGLHPEHTHSQYVDEEETHFKTREEKFDNETYRQLAQNPKVVGIGECGLDYYRLPQDADQEAVKQKQKEAFVAQIKLAKELDKALVIHSRSSKGTDDAALDILEILKNPSLWRHSEDALQAAEESQINKEILRSAQDDKTAPLRFVLHSYTGSPELLQEFINLGGFVSFNGIITFDKTGNMEKLVKSVPLDRIVLETDCPYLAPAPMRGKRNEPAYVQYVARKVADLLGLTEQEIAERTTENAQRLFSLAA